MKKNCLKISIITVCLNSESTIEQTIQSVIGQDYPNIEYIVVDGGSTDKTLDLIRKYEKYISYWVSGPDEGIYDAMNKGLKMATGDFIAFLNSDDWYVKGAISYIVRDIIENKKMLSCYAANIYRSDELQEWDNVLAEDINNIRLAMFYCHQGIFAHKSLFLKYGAFDTRYKICADYDWLLRVYDSGIELHYKNFAVVNFRLGGVSSMQSIKMQEEAKTIALLSLDKLKAKGKITDDTFDEIYGKITRYYDKNGLDCIMKMAIDSGLTDEDENMRKELKKLFPEESYSVFGCGDYGRECSILLQYLGCQQKCFWDNDSQKWGMLCRGILVKSPHEIRNEKIKIIVSTELYADDICKQLCGMGLKENADYFNYNDIRRKAGEIFQLYYL